MGLDTSHNCWHGAYSGFNTFRETLAQLIGMNLRSMEGFGGDVPFESNEKEPLNILLNHSDCDGEIEHKDTLPLANRMQELLDANPSLDEYTKRKMVQFIEGLKNAHEVGENVDFH